MDKNTQQGELAEISVQKELLKSNWHIFDDITGKAPIDLIAYKDGKLYTIAVRSTRQKNTRKNSISYKVELASIRGYGDRIIPLNTDIDILAIYLVQDDIVCFIPIEEIKNKKRTLTISLFPTNTSAIYYKDFEIL